MTGVATSTVLEQLNGEMAEVVEKVRRSLVQVSTGRRGVGAGTIWHPEGLIVTNAHVVGRRSRRVPSPPAPRVTLPDGSVRPARLLAWSTDLDVAALMVEADGLIPIELGESKGLQPGQRVVALAHPWGVPGAATGGVVIGAGSDLPETPACGREWIAGSLPLRPGYSGGPLVDAQGRLVGLNTMLVGPQVGMAVPVHVVKQFLRREVGTAVPPP
jgi:serine protease Do